MRWSKVLRRAAALFLAVVTVWMLTLTADMGAAISQIKWLGESADFVQAALRAELGAAPPEADALTLNGWGRLLLGQSARLRAGEPYARAGLSSEDLPAVEPPVEAAHDTPGILLPPALAYPGDDIVSQTLVPNLDDTYAYTGGVFLYNRTSRAVNLTELAAAPLHLTAPSEGPQVLIVHTHGTEAYTQQGSDLYAESDPYRTVDTGYNVVAIGAAVAEVYTAAGLTVLHDQTLHDYPHYNNAYVRSYQTVEDYLAEYPSIQIVLDIHRDALIGDDGSIYKVMTDASIGQAAQVMLVVGTDESGGNHPDWKENLTLAIKLQQAMNAQYPTLARPITMRTSHYNQQLASGSLLVEIGCHGNTLREAMEGAKLFAQATSTVLLGATKTAE